MEAVILIVFGLFSAAWMLATKRKNAWREVYFNTLYFGLVAVALFGGGGIGIWLAVNNPDSAGTLYWFAIVGTGVSFCVVFGARFIDWLGSKDE